jgi:hypothetical protein
MALMRKLSLGATALAGVLTDERQRNFYRQRSISDIGKREQASLRLAQSLPALDGPPPAEALRISGVLDERGFAMLDGVTPKAWIDDIRSYFSGLPCTDPYHKDAPAFVGPQNAPPGTHVAFFDAALVVKAPRMFEIANNPVILHAVARVLGAKPTIGYMAAWWTVPAGDGTAQHAENFHRDVDDLRFIKFFTYLTEVDEESGPHVYVPGSHKNNKLTKIRRYTDEEVTTAFGADSQKRFTGPAGTAFLENTYGFHRGFPAKSKPRLLMQVLYSLRPVPYGPKAPVCRIGHDGIPAGLDPYTNRVYCLPA